jgi:hypothetical protein
MSAKEEKRVIELIDKKIVDGDVKKLLISIFLEATNTVEYLAVERIITRIKEFSETPN